VHDRPSPAADLVWALVWIAFGAAVAYGSWAMDRLESMHINPYTVPGLVPGMLGGGIVLMGAMLLARALRAGGFNVPRRADDASAPGRLVLATALCLAYGAGLVGRGIPFWAATFLFVFVAIALFQWPERRARGELGRGLAVAAACAVGTAAGVTLLFQELFLVRLP
jgi:putative tricarboxylic transport membrane protein